MNIGIHGKKSINEHREVVQRVFQDLNKRECNLFASAGFLKTLKNESIDVPGLKTYQPGDSLNHLDIMITVGGDGTLLEAVTHIGRLETPILGINTGRMGFLATTAKENIEKAIDEVFLKEFTFDYRSLLSLQAEDGIFDNGKNFALNDFTILKKDTSSMILVHAFVDGEILNSYWADGIIVSTPTGSTGYSLSCGGPLIMPQSRAFIITPVSPHNLTARPILVPDHSRISFRVESRSKHFLVSLDSRFKTVDNNGLELHIQRADFNARLIKLKENTYFKTIRQKLSWGVDIRN
ncbi:MAG: NAD kinase [Cyclobacteriaceae bacterium]|nr:NAD kinase [Cyclobacteriaceae bacterium]